MQRAEAGHSGDEAGARNATPEPPLPPADDEATGTDEGVRTDEGTGTHEDEQASDPATPEEDEQ